MSSRISVGLTLALLTAAGTLGPEIVSAQTGTVFASGLTNPRRVRFGPGGQLYVAEAGVGGAQPGTCSWPGNVFSVAGPYLGGYSGRVSRIRRDGTRETVAAGLPSFKDGFGDALGPSDIAWVGGTLYVLIEGGGCTRGLPDDPAGVVRINADGTYTYVANITAFIRANPVAVEPLCGPEGDCEPDGVPHSMFAFGNQLYVVETNHSSVLKVNPSNGAIERVSDLSVLDPAPIVMMRDGPDFLLGAFDGLILSAERDFGQVEVVDDGYGPIVDILAFGNRLYLLETFAADTPWTPETGRVVRVETDGTRTVVASGLNFPIGMANQGNDLYVSTVSYGHGPVEGLGKIVRIPLR
jgi:hypothetical protein